MDCLPSLRDTGPEMDWICPECAVSPSHSGKIVIHTNGLSCMSVCVLSFLLFGIGVNTQILLSPFFTVCPPTCFTEEEEVSDTELTDLLAETDDGASTTVTSRLRLSTRSQGTTTTATRHSLRIQHRAARHMALPAHCSLVSSTCYSYYMNEWFK